MTAVRPGALDDVRVLDFTWALAGPGMTRILADHGATVVRVESGQRPDVTRTSGPFLNDRPHTEGSGLFATYNAGKLGLSLDLSKPMAREVVADLVRWSDVVCESFAPGVMASWGLDYDRMRETNPRVIVVSSSLAGQSGPLARFAGFGNMAAAMAGFYTVCGWPDLPPSGPFSAYTDYIAPPLGVAAVLAAIDFRERTGRGQYVDLSQIEAALHFLAPALLEVELNGETPERVGNLDPHLAPHGVYPAAGDDRWVAIVCRTDDDWAAFVRAIGRDDLAADPRLADAAGRVAHRGEIDPAIAAWTGARAAEEVEATLQAAGVPASVVAASRDSWSDEQLRWRNHFVELPHPTLGRMVVEGSRVRLSRTPAVVDRTAPVLGADNQYVLETLLGYDEERITALVAEGALD